MIDYILNKPTRFDGGTVIGLSVEQAKDRIHNLESAGKDIYKVLSPIMMKAGELVSLADLPKGIADRFDRPGAILTEDKAPSAEKRSLEELARILKERDKALSALEGELLGREESLSALEESQAEKASLLDERKAQLDERERLLGLREEGLNEREKAISGNAEKKQSKQAK